MNHSFFLEKTWDAILSRDVNTIRKAFFALDGKSQQIVCDHLQKMVSEEGWHTEQVISARAALEAIKQE